MGQAKIEIREVGPRDGLQNEEVHVPAADKIELVRRLVAAGLRSVEITACVSPRRVPQMGDHAEVIAGVGVPPRGADYAVLVPNLKGLQAALAPGVGTVAVFTAASDDFVRANIGCALEESLDRFREVAAAARDAGKRLRGYVSTAIACPYAGPVEPGAVARVAEALLDMGCQEISLGDTIGVGTPRSVRPMLDAVLPSAGPGKLAGHFHDTWGSAIANVAAALDRGVSRFDSSVGGLGGCPFAPGAAGNVATEDLARFAAEEGLDPGVDLAALARAGRWCSALVGRPYGSRAGRAALSAAGDIAGCAGDRPPERRP